MSESFTAIEYAVLVHLKIEGRCTAPAIAADLLLRPSEVETAVSDLVKKGFAQKDGNSYSPSAAAVEVPLLQTKKSGTVRMLRPSPLPASAAPAPMPDVTSVFKQARERANREKAGGL